MSFCFLLTSRGNHCSIKLGAEAIVLVSADSLRKWAADLLLHFGVKRCCESHGSGFERTVRKARGHNLHRSACKTVRALHKGHSAAPARCILARHLAHHSSQLVSRHRQLDVPSPDAEQMTTAQTDRLEGDARANKASVIFQTWQDRQ